VSKVDLHIHSTASDGRYSPQEIVRKAASLGLEVIALADHDSVDGIAPALEEVRKLDRIQFIPAVEVSTDVPSGEVHVLGYFIDYTSEELAAVLERFRNSREGRAKGMVDKLAGLGVNISWERVREIAGSGAVGRPHIAQAMLEAGYISSIGEAFERYIARDGPAYMIVEMKAAGMAGIEAYYGNYAAEETGTLIALAKDNGLLVTGGSDYHGLDESRETLMGGVEVPMEAVEKLIARAEPKMIKLAYLR